MGTKLITSLIPDMQEVIKKDGWFTDELSVDLAKRLQGSFQEGGIVGRLRLSQMGPRCHKAVWHSVHTPELAEDLRPQTKFMFQYGHIIEELAISLMKGAGHHVVGEQDELNLDGIIGHRDCVVDGAVLDVKSCTSNTFKKFKEGTIRDDDLFGYLDQLDGYLCASLHDPLVTVKDRGYLLAIEKQLGHMCLYEHVFREQLIRDRVREYKRICELPTPPGCTCGTVADGEAGNIKLDVRASYNVYKHVCFPNLRTFIYSKGPVYFTKVVKRPMYKGVPLLEIDKNGNPIYNY